MVSRVVGGRWTSWVSENVGSGEVVLVGAGGMAGRRTESWSVLISGRGRCVETQ